LLSTTLLSQKNSIKANILGIPGSYTMGIAYERYIGNKISVQLTLEKNGFNWDNNDGGKGNKSKLVPEIRYNIKSESEEITKVYFFIAAFTEFTRGKRFPSGDTFFEPNPDGTFPISQRLTERDFISPGALFGTNLAVTDKWYFELFIGPKYNLVTVKRIFNDNGLEVIETSSEQGLGIRIGFHLGYKF